MSDATGHDIASALYAARINTHVLSRVTRIPSPCHLIASLSAFLARRVKRANMHATFCVAILDPRAGSWDFSDAGRRPAIHYREATRDTAFVFSQTTVVGAFETLPEPCSATTSPLAEGDLILHFTDGLTDARDGEGEPLGSTAHGGGHFGDDAPLLTARLRGDASA